MFPYTDYLSQTTSMTGRLVRMSSDLPRAAGKPATPGKGPRASVSLAVAGGWFGIRGPVGRIAALESAPIHRTMMEYDERRSLYSVHGSKGGEPQGRRDRISSRKSNPDQERSTYAVKRQGIRLTLIEQVFAKLKHFVTTIGARKTEEIGPHMRSTNCVRICRGRRKINLTTVLAGQKVGVKQVDDQIWLVSFMTYDLGVFDRDEDRVEPGPNPFAPEKV